MKFFADLQNAGEDCYPHCNREQGLCDWCGADGWCCRQGWTVGNGCDGSFGGENMHECVLKPAAKPQAPKIATKKCKNVKRKL